MSFPDSAWADEQEGTRASVKKSSSVLKLSRKLLGTSQDMQIVDDGTTAQIEEILAQPTIACASSLPVAYMSQCMLNGDSFAQLGPSLRRLLALA
jgi:predicted transcriptional regulator